MPGFDGTGPRGMGPMTGGGRGFCAVPLPRAWPAHVGRTYGPPYYRARPAMPVPVPFVPSMTREQELDYLKDQAQAMKDQLEQIESRIQQLKGET
jgi:hypothetical protein